MQLDQLCQAFGSDDYYVSREAAAAALRSRGQFNIIHPSSGNKIDFMIARADAWGKEQIQRRRRLRILPEQEGFAARAEDIILSKMLYYQEGGSEKHLRDIGGILRVSGRLVDSDYIAKWADELGVADIWQLVLERSKPGK